MKPPVGRSAGKVTGDSHFVGAEIDATEWTARLQNEARRLSDQYLRQGLSGDDLAAALKRDLMALSPAPAEKAARGAISNAYNLGRNLEIQQRRAEIDRVVRTAILDTETCTEARHGDGMRRCRELDGVTFEVNSDEYIENHPPAKCDGREACRCFYMPVAA